MKKKIIFSIILFLTVNFATYSYSLNKAGAEAYLNKISTFSPNRIEIINIIEEKYHFIADIFIYGFSLGIDGEVSDQKYKEVIRNVRIEDNYVYNSGSFVITGVYISVKKVIHLD